MDPDLASISRALFQSLVTSAPLVGSLPEAPVFDQTQLLMPADPPLLNLQQKLGHLYEDAFTALIELSPSLDLLEQNLQLQQDRHTTVGELDFLLVSASGGPLIHLELATKFYLAVPIENDFLYPGPDARDNYPRKLKRLREHQLILPKKFTELLPSQYSGSLIESQQLVQGCLFDHLESRSLASPDFVNPACRRGHWLAIDELLRHFPDSTRFRIIPKPLWPAPLDLIGDISLESWTPKPALDRCVMLQVNDEPKPLFVTPKGYPYATPVFRT